MQRYAENRGEDFKSGRTQSFLTGSTFRGEALKERSEGSWRSGRRRSGDVGGGGTATVSVFSVSCRASTEHALCQKTEASPLITHCDLPLQSDCFLIVWIDLNSAQRILTRLAAIASFQENFTE